MMGAVGLVPNSARIAELWARFKAELDTKLDKKNTATGEEVTEMLAEVFGSPEGSTPAAPETAADEEVEEMLQEVLGTAGSSERNIATEAEIAEMLSEVFGTLQVNIN